MRQGPFALRSSRIVTSAGERAGVLTVRGGKIASIGPEAPKRVPLRDLGFLAIFPGVVDTHVHVGEPGRTDWEGFATATRAAAAGGVTTIVDMPTGSIPVTTTASALEIKRSAARGQLHVDCAFWGGVVPGNAADLGALAAAGAKGGYTLLDSGIDGFSASDTATLRKAMAALVAANVPLLAHAELVRKATASPRSASSYGDYLATRPRAWEFDAIRLLARLCAETRCRTHIVHLSSADTLGILAKAKADGLPLTAETCPHYLTFASESIPPRSPAFKCAPPIRERENRERLWQGLREGVIDLVVSDHSPNPPDLKVKHGGDFMAARGGIASLQFSLSAVWTGASARGFDLVDVARWMCQAPARLAGLSSRKGALEPGMDADFAIFDPGLAFIAGSGAIHHRHPLTPYLGMELTGVVLETYVRGQRVYDHGSFSRPHGDLL